MSLAPTPSPTPVGAEEEGGTLPPGSPHSPSGRCDACGKPMAARQLNLILMPVADKVALICGPCFVDGVS